MLYDFILFPYSLAISALLFWLFDEFLYSAGLRTLMTRQMI
jgi:hypothetical protein